MQKSLAKQNEEKRRAAEKAKAEKERKRREEEREASAAARRIQRLYRASIVKKKLQKAPTDGSWALTLALRNQLAVRDFKQMKENEKKKDQESLARTYRGSIADKILQEEDEDYKALKQAKKLEVRNRWKDLVMAIQKTWSQSRTDEANTWLKDNRTTSPFEAPAKTEEEQRDFESQMLRKYQLDSDQDEAEEGKEKSPAGKKQKKEKKEKKAKKEKEGDDAPGAEKEEKTKEKKEKKGKKEGEAAPQAKGDKKPKVKKVAF